MASEPRKYHPVPVDEDPVEQLNLDPNLQSAQTVVELHSYHAHEVRHPLRLIQWLTGHPPRSEIASIPRPRRCRDR